jgi:hypothetical protein
MKKYAVFLFLAMIFGPKVFASDTEMCKNYLYSPTDSYFKYYVEGKELDCIAIMKAVHDGIESRDNAHFGDEHKDLDPLWELVYDFFKESTPSYIPITISYNNTSSFDWFDMQIFISANHAKGDKFSDTVVHESSHLALFKLTGGASNQDKFRFFDEGFAQIMGSKIYEDQVPFKQNSMRIAAEYIRDGKVSFAKIQDWKKFFGDPRAGYNSLDFESYDVGASFVYFVIDHYGEEVLYTFFEDIGKTKNLSLTVESILKENLSVVEAKWLKYVESYE